MTGKTTLVLSALLELLRYEVVAGLFGFRRVHHELAHLAVRPRTARIGVDEICSAMACALVFYWKPARCLQRSTATVRLLRKHGWEGRLVIGYRPVPFFSHAWAEVHGVIVNDSPVYRRRLRALETV